MRGRSQKETVLYMLQHNPQGVCGTRLLELHIPRYSARLNELRNGGYPIRRRPCTNEHHRHQGQQFVWYLDTESDPNQTAMFD